jgi:predicted helicase
MLRLSACIKIFKAEAPHQIVSEMHPDRFIVSCTSWDDFFERTKRLPTDGEKGAAFERFTQLYLQVTPEYQTELQHVWTIRDVPPNVRRLLDLPTLDEGIDFIARTRHGKYWAIQSKFRSQHDRPLTRRELGTFSSLAFNTCSNIELAVVAHTASKPVSKRHLMRNTTEIGLDRWQSLDQEATDEATKLRRPHLANHFHEA